ncbi:MAG: aminotransferase class III-fold pyridoxal phosphate-dependent enzyme [Cellvibrionaceae bacterium]|nr:aminotransferase class III-fold pyridoxal phosphate-dependent enzyme [Cellvibrionaceae bacterium]
MTSIVYPTTNLANTEQLCLTKGKGIYIYDDQGKEYIEGMSGLWCTSLGYGNEELIEVACEQMRKLTYSHLFGGKTHPAAMALADKLSAMVPIDNAKVFFGNSGSDANDTNIKLVRYYMNAIGKPEKKKIIARERAYHGVTIGAACLTGLPVNHSHFDLPFEALGILRTGSAHFYRDAVPGETETDFSNRRASELEALILDEGPETIAAFIVEPIAGAGGVITPPEGYFAAIAKVLNKYDILLIDDEVICGFGRTGNDFGATSYGFAPDIMTLAKAMSSAYAPISASVISGDFYDALISPSQQAGVLGHGYTYSGHPVSCAIATKVIDIYQRDNLFEQAAQRGQYLQEKLSVFQSHPMVGEVRGKGLIAAVELVADKKTAKAFADSKVGYYCQQACQDLGLIIRTVAGSSIAFCPPLIVTEAQIDEMLEKFTTALEQTQRFAQQNNLLTT